MEGDFAGEIILLAALTSPTRVAVEHLRKAEFMAGWDLCERKGEPFIFSGLGGQSKYNQIKIELESQCDSRRQKSRLGVLLQLMPRQCHGDSETSVPSHRDQAATVVAALALRLGLGTP